MDRLTFAPLLGSPLFVGVFLAVLIAGLWFFPLQRVAGSRRRVLLGLRGALYFLFAVLLLRPTVLLRETVPLPSALLVAVDTSESMALSQGETTRFEALKRTLLPLSDQLRRFIDSGNELLVYGFDAHALALPADSAAITLPDTPQGELTAFGTALPEMLAQNAGKRILGTILLSDGTEHAEITDGAGAYGKSAQDAALRFRDAKVPIWAVCFGQSDTELPHDIAVKELSLPARVFSRNTITVSGLVQATGCQGESTDLTLEIEQPDGTTAAVGQTSISAESGRELIPFSFKYAPEHPGQWKISVRAEQVPGEILSINNVKSDFIDVIDGGFALLCLEGTTRFEQKFIRLALESSAELRTDYARITPDKNVTFSGASEVQRLAASAAARASLAENFFAPGQYAGYILGDIDSSAFKPEELRALADRVRDGAGLILTAGERAFSAGGYDQTPLAQLFPVTLDGMKRLPLDAPPELLERQRRERRRPAAVEPTPFGEEHYLTGLSVEPEKSRQLWQALPELETVWPLGQVKEGADILLQTRAASHEPILITQTVGKGRVALVATDSTWRWSLGGFGEEQRRFWRQLALWCANRDQLRPGELLVQLDRHRFTPSETIPVRILYRPLETQRAENLRLDVQVQGPDGPGGAVALRSDKNTGGILSLSGNLTADTKGDYLITAQVADTSDPAFRRQGNGRFLIEQYNPELENSAASPETLANMARITSGGLLTPEALPGLVEELLDKAKTLTETRQSRQTLYDRWPLFVLFILLISCEWFLRKKWGEV
ncbi:MAG: hypothetical protein IJH68_01895 [Thermoguttaceae bacterium]|nr:hypothetical protein [Thermoguttaceae bacterium]MBQ6618883.1 hypothetical protein [Thermoguttaceae bacterium]